MKEINYNGYTYVVSNEEIKSGDYVFQTYSDYYPLNKVTKVISIRKNKTNNKYWITTDHDRSESFRNDIDWCMKIVKTNDPLLS